MSAYYNEIDPYAAQWLRNLIAAGAIAPGDVDERSIVDVRAGDLASYAQCHFFAGIGGWSYALRLAGWPDDGPVWTGSCPCQPFSLAGARQGFDDDRHLWPHWAQLIAERHPPVVFGEQIASAAEWLRLVRGDLEALGYAVGCAPIEAASAGADHLRDRFWFVAHGAREQVGASGQPRECGDVVNDPCIGRGEGRPEHGVRSGRPAFAGTSGAIDMADADDARPQGRLFLSERASERALGADGVADAKSATARTGDDLFAGQPDAGNGGDLGNLASDGRPGALGGPGADSDIPDAERDGLRSERPGTALGTPGGMQGTDEQRERVRADTGAVCLPEYEWVIGADGKARRVKPGIRLLAHDVPARVAKLRAFGNAIVPQVAAEFIAAFRECQP